jgi:PAS domain S-box-containing protein
LRLAWQATRDVIWDWDVESDARRWSSAGTEIFGWTEAVDEPQPSAWWTQRIHPGDRARVAERFKNVIGDPAQDHWEDEYRFLRRDGQVATVLDRAFVRRDAAGAARRVIGAMQDITDRKRAEDALRESEERLRLAMDGAGMGSWDADVRTGTAIWNRQTYAIMGYEPNTESATVEMWRSRVHPDDLPRVLAAGDEARGTRDLYAREHRIRRRDTGEVRWLAPFGRFIYDDNGEAVRFIGVLFDITERKRAEEDLHRSEERYRSLFERAAMSLWEEDWTDVKRALDALLASGERDLRAYLGRHPEVRSALAGKVRLLDANAASLEMFEARTMSELLAGFPKRFPPEALDGAFIDQLLALAHGHDTFSGEAVYRTCRGRHFRASVSVSQRDVSRMLVSIVDMTARKQA